MLLGFDEYPYHQITASFAGVAGSDPQWNDGHYLCLADQAGQVCLASSLRLYHNNDVLDGFVCVRHDGRQHNIRLSRRLRPHMDQLAVGPLRLEIVEPMRVVRLVLQDNESGVTLDVTCRSMTVPYEDPAKVTRVDGRLISERMTYEITGKCDGWVRAGGAEVRLTAASFFRNHSWGYHAGRGATRRPPLAHHGGCLASGSGCCSTCRTTAVSTSPTRAVAQRQAREPSCSPTAVSR